MLATSTANSSRHPVRGPNNRAYPYSTRLAAPYNNITTARDSNTQAGNTASPRVKADSVVINCFDCHTAAGYALSTTRTTAAHGNAAGLRGVYYTSATPTLCTACHIGPGAITYLTTTQHGAGSAFAVGDNNIPATTACYNCHFSQITASPARPIAASDIHGFNGLLATGGAWTYGNATGMRPIAFIRNVGRWTATDAISPRPYVSTTTGPGQSAVPAAGQSNCGGAMTSGCNNSMGNYSPGGSY